MIVKVICVSFLVLIGIPWAVFTLWFAWSFTGWKR